ncbi:MAG: NAD-dependent epimerase/dehydratase family protein [Methanomassiliicoccales archaeon]|nr:NAD-dependent epimerase/dehydratase family protein [Methanomassiliicoccales archaeon]
MNVLVTGAAGQLGSYLLDELSRDHDVRGIDIKSPKLEAHSDIVSLMDIRDAEGVIRECSWADAVVHAAAQVSVEKSIEDPLLDAEINIIGTLNLLKSSIIAGVGLFVYISSAAVYGDPKYLPVDEAHPTNPKSPYGISKLTGEEYVRSFGECHDLDYFIIRPFNFYSPRADPRSPYSGVITKFVQRIKAGEPIVIEGDGEQTRDFIHALDVAHLVKLAIDSPVRNITMNCGSGRGISINELADVLASICGDVEVVRTKSREGDIRHSVADISLARDFLGFEPRISLHEGLKAFFENDE